MTSFWKKKLKIIFFSPPGGARELKLRPFDSESKTTSDCSNSLFSKKITLNSYFSFYQYKKWLILTLRLSRFGILIFLLKHVQPLILDSITFKDFNFCKNFNTFIQILIHFRPLNKTKWIFLINWKVNFVEKRPSRNDFPFLGFYSG